MKWKAAQVCVFLTLWLALLYRSISTAGFDEFLRQGPLIPVLAAGYCFIAACIIFNVTLRIQLWLTERHRRRLRLRKV